MEANAGLVAGSHKRNELVRIRHDSDSAVWAFCFSEHAFGFWFLNLFFGSCSCCRLDLSSLQVIWELKIRSWYWLKIDELRFDYGVVFKLFSNFAFVVMGCKLHLSLDLRVGSSRVVVEVKIYAFCIIIREWVLARSDFLSIICLFCFVLWCVVGAKIQLVP